VTPEDRLVMTVTVGVGHDHNPGPLR
jgi:hypothetical protein